jgi:NifU-like protein involved in Fe-S cluster formation
MFKLINAKKLPTMWIRLVSFYHDNVIDHYEKPRNVGSLDKSKKNVGTGLVGAPACGDVMKLQIELTEDGQTIEKAVFKVFSKFYYRLSAVVRQSPQVPMLRSLSRE